MVGPARVTRRAVVTVTVVALEVVVAAFVALMPSSGAPHRVPVAISAPAVVASTLADQADRRPDAAIDAHPVGSMRQAIAELRDGTVVVAVEVDLRRDRTTVLVASAQGEQVTRAVVATIRPIADSFGTSVTTRDVVPAPSAPGAPWALRVLVAAVVALGLGLAVVVTWRRGPVADDRREAVLRTATVVTTSAVVTAVVAAVATSWIGGSWLAFWAVGAMAAVSVSALTLALESVLGVAGVGLAATVAVATAAPLLRVDRIDLMAPPWRSVTPWLPHGAALDAFRQVAFFDASAVARPLVVLGAWSLVSVAVLVVARRERARAGVRWAAAATRDATAR